MDYLLGSNPEKRSYMVGFGHNPPVQAHHRGAAVPVKSSSKIVSYGESFASWFTRDVPNPNELTGAIMGGPDCMLRQLCW
jgi:endoglucanase